MLGLACAALLSVPTGGWSAPSSLGAVARSLASHASISTTMHAIPRGACLLDVGIRRLKGDGLVPRRTRFKIRIPVFVLASRGGLSRDRVQQVVDSRRLGLRYCYRKELRRLSPQKLFGMMELTWTITPDGSVSRFEIQRNSLQNEVLEGCVRRQIERWPFPEPDPAHPQRRADGSVLMRVKAVFSASLRR